MHDSYKKCYTNTLQTVKTICRIHNPSAKKGDWAILMFVQSYFHLFFNFSPKSIRKCSFIQMRSFRETHLKIYPLPSSYPQFLRNLGAIILKYIQKTTCTKLKDWCCSSTMCWICVRFLWARYR